MSPRGTAVAADRAVGFPPSPRLPCCAAVVLKLGKGGLEAYPDWQPPAGAPYRRPATPAKRPAGGRHQRTPADGGEGEDAGGDAVRRPKKKPRASGGGRGGGDSGRKRPAGDDEAGPSRRPGSQQPPAALQQQANGWVHNGSGLPPDGVDSPHPSQQRRQGPGRGTGAGGDAVGGGVGRGRVAAARDFSWVPDPPEAPRDAAGKVMRVELTHFLVRSCYLEGRWRMQLS